MKFALFVVSLLALSGTATATSAPVTRVVNLLKDLSEKLVVDEKAEQKVYDKFACWCETTSNRKADSINQGSADMRVLGQTILKLKGTIATLTSEIDELNAAIKKNLEDQAEATSIRAQQNADWTAETAETKEALAALEKAVNVLVTGTSASLLQEQTRATAAVKRVVEVLPMNAKFSPDQVALLSEFLGSAGTAKYAPQSDTVQGMLKDMYETFAANVESGTATEAKSNRDFEDFIAVKTEEKIAAEAEIAEKTTQKADAESRLADTQSMYDDTEAQKAADIDFFDKTKSSCEAKSEEWNERSSLRAEELAGINEAIEILTSDAARELFASAIKPGQETGAGASGKSSGMDISASISFLQVDTQAPTERAYAMMKKQASKNHSLRLAALAVKVRAAKAGHFDKVIASINEVIQELKDEGQSDIDKRDQCKSEFQNSASVIKETKWMIEKNDAKIAKLDGLIQLRTEQKMKTIEEINELMAQLAQMKADREAENEAFMFAKKEDMASIDLLTAAREAMSKFYVKQGVEMGPVQGSVKLLQEPVFKVSADQAPDASFSGKGSHKGESKGIVSILTMIIEDLDDEIKNGMKAEEEAQVEYEGMRDAGLQLKEELGIKVDSLSQAISKRNAEKTNEIEVKRVNNVDLKDEEDYVAEITPDCDWIIGAFEKRATARAVEIEGLTGAKEFLSGAKAPSLLQQNRAFDDNALSGIKFLGLRK